MFSNIKKRILEFILKMLQEDKQDTKRNTQAKDDKKIIMAKKSEKKVEPKKVEKKSKGKVTSIKQLYKA